MEEWKFIEGYNKKYQVSNTGRVRSLYRVVVSGNCGMYHSIEKSIRELKPHTDKLGYKQFTLMQMGEVKVTLAHRLVAEAFIPNPENKPYVNHIDFNPSNNNVENLEWVTQKENVQHSVHRYRVPHNRKTNSGEKYIWHTNYDTFKVNVKPHPTKTFKTIEEAITYRNMLLKEMA